MFYDKELYKYESTLARMAHIDSKLDYSYKSILLKKESVDLLKSVNRVERELAIHDHWNDYKLRNWLYNSIGCCGVLESIRIENAYRHKLNRLEKRISRIINNTEFACFVTFTFDEKHINSNDESKRKYVRRWLKKYCTDYVANVDYGEKNGRIHYHAVVSADSKFDCHTWSYGAIKFKTIIRNDTKKLSQYVNKLTNHALKESATRQVLIYKR